MYLQLLRRALYLPRLRGCDLSECRPLSHLVFGPFCILLESFERPGWRHVLFLEGTEAPLDKHVTYNRHDQPNDERGEPPRDEVGEHYDHGGDYSQEACVGNGPAYGEEAYVLAHFGSLLAKLDPGK